MKIKHLALIVGLAFASLNSNKVNSEIAQQTLEQRLDRAYHQVIDRHYVPNDEHVLILLGDQQKLYVLESDGSIEKEYGVSTGRKGFSNKRGSKKTPYGIHMIIQKYGDNAPIGTVFDVRRRTRHVYRSSSGIALVTSRVLMLGGVETDNINTCYRSIYLHGTNKEHTIGKPSSDGCIRMKNRDVVELYDIVDEGTYVNIVKN